jgi:hypothetical protein
MRSKVTAVSYLHSGVNDSAVHVTAVSMTPLRRVQLSQISLEKTLCRIICEIIRHKVGCTEVSVTPLCMSQRCQLCRLSSQIRSHIRKGFSLCIRGPGEVV